MRSPYFIPSCEYAGAVETSFFDAFLLYDERKLSREDCFILEKHSQDILKLLIMNLLHIDARASISKEEQKKARRLLEEFLETRNLLERE